ncbi:MAG: MlaD family protein [Brevundimonas sp.]|uniref:MlaD family protein n=1 Tax=Brevundimonas sp. TaxID=1871086 RepID=UPI00391A6AA4
MERDAHYAAVGLATIALVAALVVFSIWLARFQFSRDYDVYDIVFDGPVRGLSTGGEVHFNGIRVGEVTQLNLDRRTGNRVIARIRLDSQTPVRVDSRAQLEPQGITGVNYIQITAGTPDTPLLKTQFADNQVPVIQSQPSPIAELLQGGGTVLAQAVDALNRINRVLSDDNIRSFSASLSSVEAVTAELEARRSIIAEAERAMREAADALAEYRQLATSARGLVEGDGARALASLERAAGEAERAMSDVRRITGGLEGPVNDFANTGLPQLSSAIRGLEAATESLERLVEDVRQSPRDFIQRAPSRELEVEQ